MSTPLPLCRWRRQPTGPGRHVCISPRVRCNAVGVPDDGCFTCEHRDHPAAPGPRRQCRHFGELLRVAPVRILHRTDGAAVMARIHACTVHGECCPNTEQVALPCCQTCPQHDGDWTREQRGWVRHLTYHLYPAGPMWRWNVAELRRRLSLFNGRRLVAIATDQASADFAEAAAAFAGDQVELLPLNNDPGRKELVSHMAMIEALASYRGDQDVTWYGHGKGVGSHAYGEGVRRWTAEMYRATLDYWPAVARELRDHAAVGVYRRVMSPATAARTSWHYSGSFRWLRNKDLYRRNWQAIDPNFYGSETYPGRHFSFEEASCLFGEFAYAGVGLYLQSEWEAWAAAAAEQWYAEHAEDLERPQLITCILTAHSQPALVHEAIRSVLEQTADDWQLVIVHSGSCASAEAFGRYLGDARIELLATGETPAESAARCGQGWAINEAWRRGRVRGDLVVHLSDDDVYAPACFASWLHWADRYPEQSAWYGTADRGRIHPGGYFELLGPLGLRGPGTPSSSLRGHVDGLQVCLRRAAHVAWPEAREVAPEADGVWMDALAGVCTIEPAEVHVGTHRHCPTSNFTR